MANLLQHQDSSEQPNKYNTALDFLNDLTKILQIIISRAHSFLRATKFQAEPWNLPFSSKFG